MNRYSDDDGGLFEGAVLIAAMYFIAFLFAMFLDLISKLS